MRIIAGSLGGRTLSASGFQGTRPTTDRARETLFNILANTLDFDGAHVLDLCAGTGALGIEALSRGAAFAVFVEKSRSNARLLAQTLASLDLQNATHILTADALHALQSPQHFHTQHFIPQPFTLVFCDPPYAAKLINPVFAALSQKKMQPEIQTEIQTETPQQNLLSPDAVFVAEHDRRESVLIPRGWHKLNERTFGETIVEIFQRGQPA
jgi:16S rRNA (guanine966-N2)-methyltransferase